MRKILILFSAGCSGGLAYSIAVSTFASLGITSALGVSFHYSLGSSWVYAQIVWGGIWGLLFLLPLAKSNLFLKASMLSLFPSAFQLFVVFPILHNHSIAGLDLGLLTPFIILLFNWLWGVATALSLQLAK